MIKHVKSGKIKRKKSFRKLCQCLGHFFQISVELFEENGNTFLGILSVRSYVFRSFVRLPPKKGQISKPRAL